MNQDSTLDMDDFFALQNLMPTDDEKKMVELFVKAPKWVELTLDPAEEFIVTVARDPNTRFYLDSMVFMKGFRDEITTARANLKELRSCFFNFRTNDKLKILLKSVLEVGNLVNHEYGASSQQRFGLANNPGGQRKAVGFRVDGLVRLREVKSTDGKLNLLDFLVEMVDKSSPEVLAVTEDFAMLKGLRHLSVTDLCLQFNVLNAGLEKIRNYKYLSTEIALSGKQQEFSKLVQPFIKDATQGIVELTQAFIETRQEWFSAAEYFGEDTEEYSDFDVLAKMSGIEASSGSKREPVQLLKTLDVFFQAFDEAVRNKKKRDERKVRAEMALEKAQDKDQGKTVQQQQEKEQSSGIIKVKGRSEQKSNIGQGDQSTPHDRLLDEIKAKPRLRSATTTSNPQTGGGISDLSSGESEVIADEVVLNLEDEPLSRHHQKEVSMGLTMGMTNAFPSLNSLASNGDAFCSECMMPVDDCECAF